MHKAMLGQTQRLCLLRWITMRAFARISAVLFVLSLNEPVLEASSSNSHVRQKRAWIIDSFTIEEEHKGPFPYPLGNISIQRDYFVHFILHGKGVDEEPKNILKIDPITGLITVHGKVDYEQYHVLKLTFEARKSSSVVDTKLGVEINILDINDHPPVFQKKVYETTIDESMTQGSNVLTVLATDFDKPGTPNSTFQYKILSVTPKTSDVEFFIEQNGKISFKGCLDYEKAKTFNVLVEAKDNGEVVRLSSNTTVSISLTDKNNHLPAFAGRTGPGRINERESGVSILRLHVTDKDSKNTLAWKAKYTIHGDKDNVFSIHTDPETNDGILVVEKVQKKTETGLWEVLTRSGEAGQDGVPAAHTEAITVFVDDVNDPPVFTPPVKIIMVEENLEAGHMLATLTAIDPDRTYNSEFVYKIANDSDNWVTVNPKTGQITTVKKLDRESPYVVNNTYIVTLYAIDKGKPPLTGTGSLIIHLKDQNDNVPELLQHAVDMCLSDGPTTVQIAAHDRDQDPFAGPYLFELQGDVKGKWHLDPYHGETATLVREKTVYAGPHQLQLKVYDTQGHNSLQNLSVTVCDCTASPNCQLQRAVASRVTKTALGVILMVPLMLLGILLLATFLSCKKEKSVMQVDHGTAEYLISSNTETPGTDCPIPNELSQVHKDQVDQIVTSNGVTVQNIQRIQPVEGKFPQQPPRKILRRSMSSTSHMKSGFYQSSALRRSHSTSRENYVKVINLRSILNQKINSIQAHEELLDDRPKVYSYEGDEHNHCQLDCISIPDSEFTPDRLQDLGPRFNGLAAVSRPTYNSR
ncbi:cadherin-like protein 26 isoform X2 [Brienomyrus brachyistius]|uniref:cadherin-like protein 26 isoform X2 n=1 Tax=Brienomyrus brachyistius TaxID=42636 RepID=UPI0020B1DEF8|nr:cadherin-like protein 26 isoform X2 [Brienomyrus brachyistius]